MNAAELEIIDLKPVKGELTTLITANADEITTIKS
jgi:hypothetical protein